MQAIPGHWPGSAAAPCNEGPSRQLLGQHFAQPACRSRWCTIGLHSKVWAVHLFLLCPSAMQNGSRLQLSCTLVQVLARAEGNAASGGDYQAQPTASLSQAAACTRQPQGNVLQGPSPALCRWPCLSGCAMSQQSTPWLWPCSSRPSCFFSHKVCTVCNSHAPCLSAAPCSPPCAGIDLWLSIPFATGNCSLHNGSHWASPEQWHPGRRHGLRLCH